MSQMFNGCSSLSYLDTTNWDMSNVTGSFSYMFTNCKNLTAVDVDGWVTKDMQSISFMFLNCNKLEKILRKEVAAFASCKTYSTS